MQKCSFESTKIDYLHKFSNWFYCYIAYLLFIYFLLFISFQLNHKHIKNPKYRTRKVINIIVRSNCLGILGIGSLNNG